MRKLSIICLLLMLLGLIGQDVFAHVPYVENRDFSQRLPFKIRDSVENSMAIYALLYNGKDVDVYTFEVTEPVRVFVSSVVPICPAYESFLPWFAVVGPGLPLPEEELPFEIPEGYGAVVVKHSGSNDTLEQFCEPVGGKYYYLGPIFDETVSEPGTYYVYYWDPEQRRGDYIASIGFKEFTFDQLTFIEQLHVLIYSPLIRLNLELHTRCPQNDLPACP